MFAAYDSKRFDIFSPLCEGCSGGLDAFRLSLNNNSFIPPGRSASHVDEVKGYLAQQACRTNTSPPVLLSIFVRLVVLHFCGRRCGTAEAKFDHRCLVGIKSLRFLHPCHFCCTWLDLARVFLRFQKLTINKSVRKRMPPKCDPLNITPPWERKGTMIG